MSVLSSDCVDGRLGDDMPVPSASMRALGVLLGVLAVGALNQLLLMGVDATWWERVVLHVIDGGTFALVGLLASAAVWAFSLTWLRRWRWWFFAAISVGVGALTLPDDLEHFSQEAAVSVPAWLVLALGTLSLALATPMLVLLAGRVVAKIRYGRPALLVAALAVMGVNAQVLPADYFGIHLCLAAVSTSLAATALASASPRWLSQATGALVRRSRRRSWVLFSLIAAIGLLPLFAPLPAQVKVLLGRSESSAFYRLASRARVVFAGARNRVIRGHGEWFTPRDTRGPIPASQPPLLPQNAVIVLITVDALRADVVNSAKYDSLLPNIARLRKESIRFSRARAAATLTKLSLSSLFMSSYFPQQYWTPIPSGGSYAPREDHSLRFPEVLQRAHVHTLNFQSIFWLRNGNGSVRGFDEETYVPYDKAKNYYTPSPPVLDAMLPVLSSLDERPTFVFAHLSDPHAPYTLGKHRGDAPFDRYLSEVEVVDEQLGRLLTALDAPGLRGRSLLILSADHGEAFGEHRSRTHGTTLYDETLRVPLLFRMPNRVERTVDSRVGLIDLGPTILDLMGVETPGTYMGQSLVEFLRGGTRPLTRPLLAHTRRMHALITASGLKVIVDDEQDRTELYDLTRDPFERENLADVDELVAEPLATLRLLLNVHRLRRKGYAPPFLR